MGRTLLAVIFALALLVFPVEAQIANGQNNPAAVQEHFVVQKVVYAFHGWEFLCFFNATAGSRVEMDLSSTGDNSYTITIEIVSTNHGSIVNFTTYGGVQFTNINQTVNLNYDDSYNITMTKSPFYSTVTINGIIDLYRNETVNSTVAPTYLPSSSPTPLPNTTSNTTPTPTPTVAVPEFPSWIILPLVLIATLSTILFFLGKRQRETASPMKE